MGDGRKNVPGEYDGVLVYIRHADEADPVFLLGRYPIDRLDGITRSISGAGVYQVGGGDDPEVGASWQLVREGASVYAEVVYGVNGDADG